MNVDFSNIKEPLHPTSLRPTPTLAFAPVALESYRVSLLVSLIITITTANNGLLFHIVDERLHLSLIIVSFVLLHIFHSFRRSTF